LAFVTSLCRASYGDKLKPVEVQFQHQGLSCPQDYDNFFHCPVLFNAVGSVIVFARVDLDRPLPAPNLELAQTNDQILATFRAQLQGDDLISRVKTAIAHELPSGSPSDELIAKVVYMSPRSLRRRLSNEGTTYSKLLDAVCRELAEHYIADPAQSLSEIAFLPGFSELSAFSRAFKRRTGRAPSAFREAVLT
jgi:AraC-like DNA-binding protein